MIADVSFYRENVCRPELRSALVEGMCIAPSAAEHARGGHVAYALASLTETGRAAVGREAKEAPLWHGITDERLQTRLDKSRRTRRPPGAGLRSYAGWRAEPAAHG